MDNIESRDSFVFSLKNPLKIQGNIEGKNEFIKCDKLHFVAPSLQQLKYQVTLKKLFLEGLFAAGKSYSQDQLQQRIGGVDNENNKDKDKLDAKSIIVILYSAKDFDMLGFFAEFKDFLSSGICFMDKHRNRRIKPNEVDKLDVTTLENIIGKYLEVFFISSWMETLS
jgi:hypothetical protein